PDVRARLLAFAQTLRAHGLPVSVAETMDAVEAVAAAGIERETLREALAATLVKDEGERPTFDRLFEIAFPLGGRDAEAGRRRRRDGPSGAGAGGGGGDAAGDSGGRRAADHDEAPGARAGATPREDGRAGGVHQRDAGDRGRMGRAARRQALLEQPLELFTARDVAEARDLVRELGARLRGRLARRERALR